MKQVGAVLVFHPDMPESDVKKALQEFYQTMRARGTEVQSAYVREFDPEYGGPVWYVP